jgi:hypothetical protein
LFDTGKTQQSPHLLLGSADPKMITSTHQDL